MTLDKASKMVLGGIVAGCGAIGGNTFFSEALRAWAGVLGAVAGAALLYRLDPKSSQDPQLVNVVNTPEDPVPTDPVSA